MEKKEKRGKKGKTSDAGSQYRCGRVGRGIQLPSTPQTPFHTQTYIKSIQNVHFSTFRLDHHDQRMDKASYRVACPQLKMHNNDELTSILDQSGNLFSICKKLKQFLVACMQLYNPLCLLVGLLVRPSHYADSAFMGGPLPPQLLLSTFPISVLCSLSLSLSVCLSVSLKWLGVAMATPATPLNTPLCLSGGWGVDGI